MKPFIALLMMAVSLQAQQQPVTTFISNVLQHSVVATMTGNDTRFFNIANGATRHQVTFRTGPAISAATVTLYASTNSSPTFYQVGTSALKNDSIIFYGVFDVGKIVISNFTGSGDIDADYYGDTIAGQTVAITGAPFNVPIGAIGDALKVTTVPAGTGVVGENVNVAQINGITPLMGNGVTGTGSPRVTIASDNTAFSVNGTLQTQTDTVMVGGVNVKEINGVTVLMGDGATGTGSQRVTIANTGTANANYGQGATGGAVPTGAVYAGSQTSSGLTGIITCNNYAFDRSTTADVQLVAVSGSTNIYVCGYAVTGESTTTSDVNLRNATSSDCTTGAANLTPAITVGTSTSGGMIGGVALAPGIWSGLKSAAKNLCVHRTAAQTSEIQVWYTQF